MPRPQAPWLTSGGDRPRQAPATVPHTGVVNAARIAICTLEHRDLVDPEAAVVADELTRRGHHGTALAWDADVDWAAFDLVVIRSTWNYFGRLEEFLAWVERVGALTRVVNPPAVVRWNAHKGYLAELGGRGIPVLPALAVPRGAPDADELLAGCGWDDVVIKPAVDGGARQTLRTSPRDPRARTHLQTLVAEGDAIVQPFAPGVQDGETSLVFLGGQLSHAVRKVPRAGDYRVQAHHGGTEQAHEATAEELAVARAALAAAPAQVAYARVDLVDVDGQPTLMELELIEPDLFLRLGPGSLARFADVLEAHLPTVTDPAAASLAEG